MLGVLLCYVYSAFHIVDANVVINTKKSTKSSKIISLSLNSMDKVLDAIRNEFIYKRQLGWAINLTEHCVHNESKQYIIFLRSYPKFSQITFGSYQIDPIGAVFTNGLVIELEYVKDQRSIQS
jgi:hypothetical protein